jgi:carbonic anhydrase
MLPIGTPGMSDEQVPAKQSTAPQPPGSSSGGSSPPAGAGRSAIDEVLRRNAAFAAAYSDTGAPRPPRKKLAVISCMDSRLDMYRMLGVDEGDVHVIRNAGGVVTDDMIRSLVISQRIGGTREIMVIHNTECGMLSFKDEKLKRQVAADFGREPPFAFHAFGDLEQQIRDDVAEIRNSPWIVYKDVVRGFIYDVRTGRLREIQ